MLDALLNLLFPKHCVGCNRTGHYLCQTCGNTIAPADYIDTPDTFAVFHYHDPRIKKLIWKLKYHGTTSIAQDLAPYLHDRIIEELADYLSFYPAEQITLIPAPLSKKRLQVRGYNQAEKVARALAKYNPELYKLLPNGITKIRETQSQVEIKDRDKRLTNLRNAFKITDIEAINKKTILLIDDVLTTGGTVLELRQTLEKAGAKRVFSLALAHG